MRYLPFLSTGLAALPAVLGQNSGSKDPCWQLAEYQGQEISKGSYPFPNDIKNIQLNAEMAYNCVISVPLQPDHALKAIAYMKNYSSFETTLSFLKNPPKSYQKQGVDIMARFDQVADNVKNKKYKNQWEVELDLRAIQRDSGEGHFNLDLGLNGLFTWILNDTIISLSKDGKELPQIYAFSDIRNGFTNPSPIVSLGGKPVFEYLRNYLERTATKFGFIDANADWNVLVYNGAWSFNQFGTDVQSSWVHGGFKQTSIYNGKTLQVGFANGSTVEWTYSAGSTWGLKRNNYTSGVNIYNKKVANQNVIGGSKTTSAERDDSEQPNVHVRQQQNTPAIKPYTSVPVWNYPKNPDVIENEFGIGGIVSGYILKDDSVGVLSLPSYDRGGEKTKATAQNFTDTVEDFISQAQKNKVKKIVIDLSGNGGGSTLLGYAVFKLFFPSIEPSLLGRVRATSYTNTIGSIVTGILENKENDIPDEIWTNFVREDGGALGISSYKMLDADGYEFKSWKDFFGPRKNNNDEFTNGAKYNLSSTSVERDLGFAMPGYNPSVKPTPQDQLWAAEDIILIHDGTCASTCAIFSEMMKTEAGVKSVAVGGVPEYGPMQGVAGTRGSLKKNFSYYNNTIARIRNLMSTTTADQTAKYMKRWGVTKAEVDALPFALNTSPLVVSGSVNALDMIRVSSLDTPLQFTYQASNCRLFYTFEMARDVTALWRAAGKVAGGDYSACVQGSTKAPGSSPKDTILSDPGYSYNSTWSRANSTEVPANKASDGSGGGDDTSGAAGLSVRLGGILAVALVSVLMT